MLIDVLIIIWIIFGFCGGWCLGKKLGGFIYARFFSRPTKVIVTELDGTVKEYFINEETANALKEAVHKYKL